MQTEIQFANLVDSLIEAFDREHVPFLPGVVSQVLAEVFYSTEPPEEFEQYKVDLRNFLCARFQLFIVGHSQSRWLA